ncbi:hypothetical protein LAY41_24780 [Argonema galeatum A003/A1]|nr:hypothetical protein [Argonema galeatum A003/A1]
MLKNKKHLPSKNLRSMKRDFPDVTESVETDPDDTPIEEVKASLRRALQEVKAGQRIPLSEMWEGIDVE